ncbi:50S ribosomal protein L18 [Patescibacteria group bacterium]|nr:50S ribosomal protein L18 [Patescibacteria group bacterium]
MNKKKLTILRNKRKARVRGKLKAKSSLPRLVVTRSLKHISAQVINRQGVVQAAVTSKNQSFKGKTKTEQATEIGKLIATKLLKKGITAVVLDRGSYKYHGRIKALADAVIKK